MILQNPYVELTSNSDLKDLAFLFQEIADQTTISFFNWTAEKALAEIQITKNFVILEKKEIKAFVSFRDYGDRFEIMALGTKPSDAKKGLGQKICDVLKNYANCQKLPIWLEVHHQNQAALNLYLKCGFTVVQTRKGYYPDGGDALVMTYCES